MRDGSAQSAGLIIYSSHFLFKKDSGLSEPETAVSVFRKLANKYESRKAPDDVRR